MCSVEIERVSNGYEVEVTDPEIVKANRKADSKTPWKDPHRCYVFKTIEEVLDFLKTNIDKALPADEYDSSFDEAVAAEED